MCGSREYGGNLCTPAAQFCSEPKTSLKNSLLKKIKTRFQVQYISKLTPTLRLLGWK